jgi:hypothetical protein
MYRLAISCALDWVKVLPMSPTWTTTAPSTQDPLEEGGTKPAVPPDSVTHNHPPTDQTPDQPTSIGAYTTGVVQRRQRNANTTDIDQGPSSWERDAVSLNGIALERNNSTLIIPSSSFLDDAAPKGTMAFEPERDLSRETCPILAIDSFRSAPKNASTDRLIVVGPRLPVVGGHTGRTGDRRRSCTSMVLILVAATLLMVDVVEAVFTPDDGDANGNGPLKTAITSCLSETTNGSCPIFAASPDATGNPYGVMGDWDVSKVTRMQSSKYNISSLLLFCSPLL